MTAGRSTALGFIVGAIVTYLVVAAGCIHFGGSGGAKGGNHADVNRPRTLKIILVKDALNKCTAYGPEEVRAYRTEDVTWTIRDVSCGILEGTPVTLEFDRKAPGDVPTNVKMMGGGATLKVTVDLHADTNSYPYTLTIGADKHVKLDPRLEVDP